MYAQLGEQGRSPGLSSLVLSGVCFSDWLRRLGVVVFFFFFSGRGELRAQVPAGPAEGWGRESWRVRGGGRVQVGGGVALPSRRANQNSQVLEGRGKEGDGHDARPIVGRERRG